MSSSFGKPQIVFLQGECKQRADGEEGFCHFLAVTYRDLIFDICYIATCFRSHSQSIFLIKSNFVHRDNPKILQLYNGLSCAEIPAQPNGFCNGDQGQCVVPFTPGNLTSACPKNPGESFPRRVGNRNKRKGQRKKQRKKQKKNKGRRTGRLVGPSTLHTHTRIQTMRYPWVCSLKAQGFR